VKIAVARQIRRASEVCQLPAVHVALLNPSSKGAHVLVKIYHKFFQAQAVVTHSTQGVGMGVEFQRINRPFLIVLQDWLLEALAERMELN
jgi:hypothetical protein